VFTNHHLRFIQAYILLAVFRHRTHVGSYDSSDAVTYVWLAQALIMTVYAFGWTELALSDRTGRSRPISRARSTRSATGSRSIWSARLSPDLPADPAVRHRQRPYSGCTTPPRSDLVAFFVSIVFAVVVKLRAPLSLQLGGVLAHRHPRGRHASLTVSLFFSGMILPLAFFPHVAPYDCAWAAFASIVQTPIDIWLGKPRRWPHRDPRASGDVGGRAARARPADATARREESW